VARLELPRLREVRLSKGVGLRELSEKAHVSRETLHGIEVIGRSAWSRTRDKLAEALDVHPWELLFPPEQVTAMLEADRHENVLIKRQLAAMSEEELRELAESEPGRKILAAIEAGDRERERQQDAG